MKDLTLDLTITQGKLYGGLSTLQLLQAKIQASNPKGDWKDISNELVNVINTLEKTKEVLYTCQDVNTRLNRVLKTQYSTDQIELIQLKIEMDRLKQENANLKATINV